MAKKKDSTPSPNPQPATNGKVHNALSPERFAFELGEIVSNVLMGRSQLWGALLDNKRKVDEECDYPPTGIPINVELYKQLYDREAIAARVVEVLPKETWQATPQVQEVEDEDKPLEKKKPTDERFSDDRDDLEEQEGEVEETDEEEEFDSGNVGSDKTTNAPFPPSAGKGPPVPPMAKGGKPSPFVKQAQVGAKGETEDGEEEDEPKEKFTAFELAWDELGRGLANSGGKSWHKEEHGSVVWEYLARLDILSGIGQFGVLMLGIDDGLALQEPVEGSVTEVTTNNATYVMPDSVMSDDDEKTLNELSNGPIARKVWTHNYRPKVKNALGTMEDGKPIPQYSDVMTPALSDEEKVTVNEWKAHKKAYKAATLAQNQLNTERKLNPGRVDNRQFTDLLSGTDKQYFEAGILGMGMKVKDSTSQQGTDQQYMGTQFGPSQGLVDKPLKRQHKLLFLRVFDESLVQVVRYEWNINNPRFGLPVMYRITLNDPRQTHSGVGLPLATVFVHWSRVIHVPSDCMTNSEIFGLPRMQQVLNRVLDLRKLYAASAEGYWQSCFAAISLETHPQAGGDVSVDYAGLEAMMTDFRNRLRRDILLEGMSAKTLPPQIIDSTPFVNSQIEAICIKVPCPKRVFMGSERGELASSQDDSQWNDVIRGRQQLFVTPRIIVPFIDRLILLGILPTPKIGYRIDWPDLDSLNDGQKADIAVKIAQALTSFISGGGEQIMPIKDFLIKCFNGFFKDEEVNEMILEAEKKAEADMEAQVAMVDEQGFQLEAPEGVVDPEQRDMEHEVEMEKAKHGNDVPPQFGKPQATQQPSKPFGGK